MKLNEFSLLSSELVQFACDDLGQLIGRSARQYQCRHTAVTIFIRQGDSVCVGKVLKDAKIGLRYRCSEA
jgi:hypothetical protein